MYNYRYNLAGPIHEKERKIGLCARFREYGPTVDVDSGSDAQIPVRANTVTVVEKWESLDHLAAHSVAPHMESYRTRVADYVQSVSLQILSPA